MMEAFASSQDTGQPAIESKNVTASIEDVINYLQNRITNEFKGRITPYAMALKDVLNFVVKNQGTGIKLN
jgi:hypothetical protein